MKLKYTASEDLRELHRLGLISESQYSKLAMIEAMSEKTLESEKKESYQECFGKGTVVLG